MKVLGFCEGARADSGGIGLIGVPLIHQALAKLGHRDVLAVGGRPMPSAKQMLARRIDDIFDAPGDGGAVGVVPFPAVWRWCFSPALYRAAVASVSRADFITLHSLYSFPVLAGYSVARRFKKPFGLWPHGVLAPVQRGVSPRKKALYSVVADRILNQASVLFYSAEGEREEASSLGLRTPSVVIPHGIDTTQYEELPERGAFRKKYLAGHQGPVVLYLGRLNVKKGIDILVQSMVSVIHKCPEARLVIAGGGHPTSFVGQVKTWAVQAGIAHATVLTGILDEHEKLAAFADCDVFVLPSIAENFGFAMFEAMACGRAVVCSDTLNYAFEVSRFDAGIVAKRTPCGFAEAIALLLGDADRRARLGQNGQKLARNFSWDNCGRLLDTAVQCILAKQPFPSDLKPNGSSGH
jgi:glycosyltransferase involved in cell wall biosynthesis